MILSLQLPLQTGTKLFFINEKFSFAGLKHSLELELSTPVEIDFMG